MSRKLIAGLAAVTLAAVVGGTLGYIQMKRSQDPFADCRGSGIDKDLATGPKLVYFGYTFCPDVCPLDNTRNAEAVDLLQKMGLDVTPVFISVDPERDTPQVMAEFTDTMHPNMIGLTGTAEQVKAAANVYKVYYKKQETGDQYYTMDHSTFTYLMLPGVGFVDFFNRDDTAQQMADRTACFLGKG